MNKDDLVYVGHMLDTAVSAAGKVRDCAREDFDADENLRLALTHLIQTLGEAARHVSTQFQQKNDTVPWSKIIGMCHKVVRDYLPVDYDLVWDVATQELPPLIEALAKIVPTCEEWLSRGRQVPRLGLRAS